MLSRGTRLALRRDVLMKSVLRRRHAYLLPRARLEHAARTVPCARPPHLRIPSRRSTHSRVFVRSMSCSWSATDL